MLNNKGQASLEFLMTYSWVLLVVLATVGVLFYFNIFDTSRYLPEDCDFGPNIICEAWSIRRLTPGTFNVSLKLKNNLERSIELVNFTAYNRDNVQLVCPTAEFYCPFDASLVNWSITTGTFTGRWPVSNSCRLSANCDGLTIKGTKNEINFDLTFRRKTPSNNATNHTIQGKVFSDVI